MFDDAFMAEQAELTPVIFKDAKNYTFADISQVISRNYDERHWESLQWLLRQINTHPRPSNHTKIYGSGYGLMDETIQGGGVITMSAPYKGGWVAAIVKK